MFSQEWSLSTDMSHEMTVDSKKKAKLYKTKTLVCGMVK